MSKALVSQYGVMALGLQRADLMLTGRASGGYTLGCYRQERTGEMWWFTASAGWGKYQRAKDICISLHLYILFTMYADSVDSEWILMLCIIEDCTVHLWFLTHRTPVVVILRQTLALTAGLAHALRIGDQFSKTRALELSWIVAHLAVLFKISI